MVAGPDPRSGSALRAGAPRTASVALNLELSQGRRGASARIEIHERGPGRVALVALRGWLDGAAVSHLGGILEDLAVRGVDQVLLECSRLDHIDYRLAPELVERLVQFESRAGNLVVCGLSHYLRDLFRLAGCDNRLRCWPSATELLPEPSTPEPSTLEPGRECAS